MTLAGAAETHRPTARSSGVGPAVIVDRTHCGRHVTGLERITLELFSDEALAPLDVLGVSAGGRLGMMAKQNLALPALAARHPGALVLTPGFPPSLPLQLFGQRIIPYIHDLFLITRPQDLNARAKAYMAGPFRRAVTRLPRFMVNSQHTARELRRFCRDDAEIAFYRPRVRNVFGLDDHGRAGRGETTDGPRLVALGTIEPRKNLRAAAAVVAALHAMGRTDARLDLVGRAGWGDDAEFLARAPGVRLHGYLPAEEARAIVADADALISTAHDEGLGLPLLEAQYAGLPVIAPDQAIFREALGASGVFINPADAAGAAQAILAALSVPGWRESAASAARANLARWNAQADDDRSTIIEMLTRLCAQRGEATC